MLLDQLAEAKIREANARGELSNLPGEGKPLDLTDDPLVDPSMAAINRVLKNAGFLPPQVQQLADLESALQLIEGTACPEARRRQLMRLRLQLGQLQQDRSLPAAMRRAGWLNAWALRLQRIESETTAS
jgi:hypothetical protein